MTSNTLEALNTPAAEAQAAVPAAPGGASAPPSALELLQAELTALKAKEAAAVSAAPVAPVEASTKKAKKVPKGKVAKAPKVKAPKAPKAPKAKPTEKAECSFEGCENKVVAKGLCPSHYRQKSRGVKLKTLREVGRGLVRLPMVIRVTPDTLKSLKKYIKSGKANSMYDATRQALEAGVAGWVQE
jgi:hypothetical protein